MATHHARNCTVVVCSDRRNRRQHLCQRGKSSPSLAQPYLDDRVRFLFSPASQAWQPPEHEQARLPPRLERPPDRARRVHSDPPSLPTKVLLLFPVPAISRHLSSRGSRPLVSTFPIVSPRLRRFAVFNKAHRRLEVILTKTNVSLKHMQSRNVTAVRSRPGGRQEHHSFDASPLLRINSLALRLPFEWLMKVWHGNFIGRTQPHREPPTRPNWTL